MKSLKERIQFAYEGGLVTRFHTRSGIKPSTDAAHSHGVAMLVLFLCDGTDTADNSLSRLLMAALVHDLGEQSVGDVPAPTKWAVPGMAAQLDVMESSVLAKFGLEVELSEGEHRILKLADCLEGLMYCCNEKALGNTKIHIIGDRWVNYLEEVIKPYEREEQYTDNQVDVVMSVIEIWKDLRNGREPADFTQYESD